ncbi:sugar ABC transporter permease [Ruminococcaceae bacterium OttesenSCG-928-A16]|nr:sugar ABC transporter permease [Ruminococcaceae bacterium OttesenSCG-928-A16]
MMKTTNQSGTSPLAKKHKGGYLRRQKTAPYLFALPYFLIFLAFSVFPILFSGFISLNDWKGYNEPTFIGLQNYIEVFGDPRFYKALGNTLLLMVMIIPFQLVLGFLLALFLNSKYMKLKKTFRLLNFLPYLTTPIALGVIFALLFDPAFGTVNQVLEWFGINAINWTKEVWPARALVSMVTVWRYTGYTAVLFMAGITNINTDIYEASEIDGASSWQRTFRITLPLLKPVTTFVVLSTMIGCFQIFEEPFMIFNVAGKLVGGPNNSVLTGIWLFYDTAFSNQFRNGYAAAIAVCLFAVIAVISFVANKLMSGKEDG